MNSVQPYCRLAVITMQAMPSTSWPHRVHAEPTVENFTGVVMISTPPMSRCPATIIAHKLPSLVYRRHLVSDVGAGRLTLARAAVIGRGDGLRAHRGTARDQGDRSCLRARGDDAVCASV